MATYVPAREFSNSATGQRPVFPSLLSKRSFWERFHVTGDWQHPPGKRGCYSCPWLDRARSKGGNITCSCYLYSIVSLVVTIHPLVVACLLVSCYFLYVSLTNYLWKSVTSDSTAEEYVLINIYSYVRSPQRQVRNCTYSHPLS